MIVFLNVDAGELPDEPEALYGLCHLVNVAAGGHAGDEASVARAATLTRLHGTGWGAHPSYDDRAFFGRRAMIVDLSELARGVSRQCALVRDVGLREGLVTTTVKPHGALYHAAAADAAVAGAVLAGISEALGLARIVGPPEGALREAALAAGHEYLREGLADRGYDEKGQPLPRTAPGALLSSPELVAAQALLLARSGNVETLCVHGDSPGAVELLRAAREALAAAGLLAS